MQARLDALAGDARVVGHAEQHLVGPVPDLLAIGLGHAEDRGDDLHRERRGEVGHRVELALAVT